MTSTCRISQTRKWLRGPNPLPPVFHYRKAIYPETKFCVSEYDTDLYVTVKLSCSIEAGSDCLGDGESRRRGLQTQVSLFLTKKSIGKQVMSSSLTVARV